MRIGDDYKIYFRMHHLYKFETHITEPRPCWHENPVLALARDMQALELTDHINLNGYIIHKTWSKTGGTQFKVRNINGGRVLTCKRADEAAEFVLQGTGMEEHHGS